MAPSVPADGAGVNLRRFGGAGYRHLAVTSVEELTAMSARGELTRERANAECAERRKVIGTLVGSLYPSVLRSQILAILELPVVDR
jgi:hypothetical protein